MAINYFIGWSIEDLQQELRAAQEDMAAGKTSMAAGAGEASTSERVDKGAEERIRMLLQALNALDPVRYPADQIYASTSTRIAFQ